MEVKDKVVIVTGASSGIGEATAKLLAEEGAKVALVARSKEKLNELSKKLAGSFVAAADMGDVKQVKEMVKKVFSHFGRIDILINNAGRGYHVPVMEIENDMLHELFDLDLVGPLVAMQQVVPIMKKQGQGMIINISSGTALMVIPGIGAYSSIKRALSQLSQTAREELAADGITVCVVYPYITKTNFHKNLLNGQDWEMEEGEDLAPFDTPEHVAGKILEAVKSGDAEIFAHDWMRK